MLFFLSRVSPIRVLRCFPRVIVILPCCQLSLGQRAGRRPQISKSSTISRLNKTISYIMWPRRATPNTAFARAWQMPRHTNLPKDLCADLQQFCTGFLDPRYRIGVDRWHSQTCLSTAWWIVDWKCLGALPRWSLYSVHFITGWEIYEVISYVSPWTVTGVLSFSQSRTHLWPIIHW